MWFLVLKLFFKFKSLQNIVGLEKSEIDFNEKIGNYD